MGNRQVRMENRRYDRVCRMKAREDDLMEGKRLKLRVEEGVEAYGRP